MSKGDLPATGMGDAIEQLLSPRFVRTTIYGTRLTTIARIGVDNSAEIVEQGDGRGFRDDKTT